MSSTVSSIVQMYDSLPPAKRFDAYWCRFVLRPVSFPVTWVSLRLGLSANQVSYFSAIVALLATILMCFPNRLLIITGALLFNFWAILDCVDGNIARAKGKTNKYGDFIDAFAGYVAYGFVFIGAGVAANHAISFYPSFLSEIDFVLVGALASVSNMTMRTIYQHFRNVYEARIMDTGTNARRIDSNLGITGILMPAVLAGVIFNQLCWVVLFYALFHLGAFILVGIKLAITIENKIKEDR